MERSRGWFEWKEKDREGGVEGRDAGKRGREEMEEGGCGGRWRGETERMDIEGGDGRQMLKGGKGQTGEMGYLPLGSLMNSLTLS